MDEEEPKDWIVTLEESERDQLIKDALPSIISTSGEDKHKELAQELLH